MKDRVSVLGPLAFAFVSGCNHEEPRDAHHEEGHHHHHDSAHHGFKDAAAWSKEFDDPARDAWQKPDEVVASMKLQPGMTVVDIGAGTGYFEKRLSLAVGATGKVLALDIEPDMIRFMQDRMTKEGLTNVEPRQCAPDGTGLAAASVDRVLVVDTWHHLDHREAYAQHLASILKPGGAVVVVDFTLESDKGPPKEHKLAPSVISGELASAGLSTSLVDETLPDQYIVVATKP
ncbi:MAG: methyltransferase domain-containing protein [Polyangiaceae bacterium]